MQTYKQPTAVICLSPNKGGMELDAISFSKKLDPYMKTILIIKENSFMHENLQNSTLNYETIDFFKMFSLSIILGVRRIIKKYNIQNIVFFGASELRSLYFSFLGLDINLIIRHSTTKSSPKKDFFHRLIYSKVNYHVATSKHLERNIHHIIPFGKTSESKMIYSSLTFEKPKPENHNLLTLVHTGRITHGKGQTDAIIACSKLFENDIDFQFYIVGGFEEDYKEEFMSFYNKVPYKDKIKLVGFTNDVSNYLNKSDIFIFPSYGEGLSLSFREALSNNLICIAYDNTSFPEIKQLNLNFHLVENLNTDHLGDTLLDICTHIERYKDLNNYKIMKQEFSEEKELKHYFQILR